MRKRQVEIAQVIGKAERFALRPVHQIGRGVAEDDVLLAKAQMREQVFQIGDILKNAEHDDDVGLRRRVCREVAADKIADQRALAVREPFRGLIGATERQQVAQGFAAAGAEIEHTRAGRNELRGQLRAGVRFRGSVRAARVVGEGDERKVRVDVQSHGHRARFYCRTQHEPARIDEARPRRAAFIERQLWLTGR